MRRSSAAGIVGALALAVFVVACGDDGPTAPEEGGGSVAVEFRAQAVASSSPITEFASGPAAVAGAGGPLELESLHLVVDEFKLEGDEGACEGEDPEPDCAKFEAAPHLLEVPIAGPEAERVLEEEAPAGSYTRLKFETKRPGANEEILAAIEEEGIPDWPAEASMRVTGTFTPEGTSEGEAFRVFFRGEVKIVLDLPDPLVVTGDAVEGQVVAIEVAPDVWFENEDGSAVDLRSLDYDATSEVHELEVKLEDGFTKVELER